MEREFKHQKTGEIISYKDGVIKSGSFVFELGCEPSKKYWEEIKKELPVGTKIVDTYSYGNKYIYSKLENGKWNLGTQDYFDISEKNIGEGKRFQIVEEKSVLFTTEDGVSIREGDNYWFIWVKGKHLPNYQTLYHPYFVEKAAKLDLDECWSKDARFFSTEKAARDFIIYHKPCLSIKEILSAGQRIIVDEEKLKQLVKTKIDL